MEGRGGVGFVCGMGVFVDVSLGSNSEWQPGTRDSRGYRAW